jgi:cell surface protein SprA
LKFNLTILFPTLVIAIVSLLFSKRANAAPYFPSGNPFFASDTIRPTPKDRYDSNYFNPKRNPFYLQDSSFIKRNIQYDPATRQYYIEEKIGSQYYRTPMTMSLQEMLDLKGKEAENEYFRKRASMLSNLNRRTYKPKFNFSKDWVNRIVGNGKVEIKPNGYVDLALGYQGQKINNPTLPERARKNGGLDFNMNSQFSVDANIGDKLKLPINYNTLANFDFENQLKLDYQGKDDEIIKQFQAGNTNFVTKGNLIQGAQSLFGLKTQLQFGKLYVTGVLANLRSQRQTSTMQGGTSTQAFTYKIDEYEENRHFLMSQFFRNNYNTAMKSLPVVNSLIQILRVEVWVTNRTGATTDTRDVVALMDLGEGQPYGPYGGLGNVPPRNDANSLYTTIINTPGARNSTQVSSILTGAGLQPVQDFEKTFARKLLPTDFYFNPQIGFISLNQQLQPDEVLGIAFQYTYNGKVYQVGEFSTDVPPDSTGTTQPVLFLKLLKATSQRTNLPIWDLMMKNVYAVGFGQLERSEFKLDILYEEPSLGEKRYLPPADVSDPYKGQPLITQLNLDRLNNQNDPQPDGVFDFVEGFTVISSQSRIIFPLLEPFGKDLEYIYTGPDSLQMRAKYLYYPLYDTIKAIAQTFANLNRFKISGRSKSGLGVSEYQLGFNIPRGSVTVSSNGRILKENIDYEINYDLGTLRVINQAIINAGLPVSVNFENNATFGLQTRNYLGLRLDYLASKKLSLGGTIVRMSERPYFVKQGYGDDPIRNVMYGVDFDYRDEIPRLTRWINKLPFYSTKAPSGISAIGEAALLDPGHAPQIGKGNDGAIFIDDFEGTRSSIDLRFPLISWTMSSTPYRSPDQNGNILFPEAGLNNNLAYGYNRGKLAWYNIEQVLQEPDNSNNPLKGNLEELSKPETRKVYSQEIYPNRTLDYGQGVITTFDLAFYPKEKGPYNFEYRNSRINGNGNLLNPKNAWGGIMRNIDQTDFETSNIEFIEFWLQDPFIRKPGIIGGELYFNLGNISEDALKDGKRQYENGLPTIKNPNIQVDNSSVWGRVPTNPIQVTNAFSNDPDDRPFQDVGLDGLTDSLEKTKQQVYLNDLAALYGTSSPVYQKAIADPSADNFRNYRDEFYDSKNAGILERYKEVNNPHGNSPVSNNSSEFINAFTLYPDQEELNKDNTLNESEEYFQYRVELKPNMIVGSNYITDKRTVEAQLVDGSTRLETWYLFRIPVSEYQAKVGNIPDFKSIRFIRMFLTGFEDTVVCRFGKLELIRNQWRRFTYEMDTTGIFKPLPANNPVTTDVLAVNVEENDQRQPIPYVIPPGVERQQQLSNNNIPLLLNEQSLSFKVNYLTQHESRGVFKTMNLDLRQYGKINMFIHAESAPQSLSYLKDYDLVGTIRIGNDFVSNYYEIKIPLKLTPWGSTDSLAIWPEENNMDFNIQDLVRLKNNRNKNGFSPAQYYSEIVGNRKYAIIGNPNLGEVRGMLMGVENTKDEPVSAELWFNELRLTHLDEKGGWAATGRLDITGADLFNFSLSASARSIGFGTLEQKVNDRSREDFNQIDAAINIDAGKLLPRNANLTIPFFAGISRTVIKPEYDPYDLDIKLKDKLNESPKDKRDSIKKDAVDIVTIKTLNLTNVKVNRVGNKKPKPWDLSNLDLNYSYTKTKKQNPLIDHDEIKRTRVALGYNWASQPAYVEPFRRLIKSNSEWLRLVKDFNINYKPTQVSFKGDVFRQFGALQPKNVGGGPYNIPETYDKYFTFDRFFIVRWDLTKSINFDFNAVNNARVDEPAGRIDTKEKKDSVRKNFFHGGRDTRYHHDATITYNVPMAKIPGMDWTTLRLNYRADYDWIASSLLARNLGNVITNGQTKGITSDLNLDQLYQKSRFLRAVYSETPSASPAPKNAPNTAPPKANKKKDKNATQKTQLKTQTQLQKTDSLTKKQLRKLKRQERKNLRKARRLEKQNQVPDVSGVVKGITKVLTSIKQVGIQYTETSGTLLPGYLDSARFIGQNWKSMQPGFDFLFGYQPDTNWINKKGMEGVLTHDPIFNTLINQRYDQKFNVNARVMPFRDFNIDITYDKTFNKNYSELFKDTSGLVNGELTRLNPYSLGSYSISYIAFQTLFKKFDPNIVSGTFKQFEANRVVLSEKLGKTNPYNGTNPAPGADGYYEGYGRYAQDVLIPAFIAAYTNKDPNSIALIKNTNPNTSYNPFGGLKAKPNWNITYNGLNRIGGLEKIITNATIRHGYHSTLSMNNYNSGLFFQDPFHLGFPYFIDTLTKNYVPYFLVPNITISEEFSPLISIDATFTNDLTARIEYRKSRQLSLSLIDYQLAENRSTELTIGGDWRIRGVPLIKKIGKMPLDNDITFKLMFSYRDDATANSKLDQNAAFGTAGQRVVRINPTIDYVVNSRIRMTLYFEQTKNIPKIATTAPVTNTRAGVQLRISLAQ